MLLLERKGLEKKFWTLCSEIAEREGMRLYDLNYIAGQNLLRLFIINPETKTAVIEECARVDHALTEPIEQLEWMPEVLNLEVSSPGIYRQLRTIEHFRESLNSPVSVVIRGSLDSGLNPTLEAGQLKEKRFSGLLTKVENDFFQLKTPGEEEVNILFEQFKKANIDPEIDQL